MKTLPSLGIGIGLRQCHVADIVSNNPDIDWFELVTEHFLDEDSKYRDVLDFMIAHYPVVLHGLSLNIGSSDALNFDCLKKLKKLARYTKSPWVSDHFCWSAVGGVHYHDLLPLMMTKEVAKHVAERARVVQDFLEVPLALENISSYASFQGDEMTEWEFCMEVLERADIRMLLDVNNVYVSGHNNGFDPDIYIDSLPAERVIQIHVAGFSRGHDHLLDTHDSHVAMAVWELYRKFYAKTKGVSTLLEWDDNNLSLAETWQEALKAKLYHPARVELQDAA